MKKIMILLVVLLFSLVGCQEKEEVKKPKKEEVVKEKKTSLNWGGEWNYSGLYDGGTITITNEKEKTFDFVLSVYNGAHFGEISGVASIEDNRAIYKENDFNCEAVLTMNSDVITVSTNQGCQAFGGLGAVFDGDYIKGPASKPNLTLFDLQVFKNKETDNKFKALVGDDYQLFTERFQLQSTSDDLDGFNAKVISGGVRGLFTIMESIIVYDEKGTFWAAVLTNEDVRYYSNDPKFKDKLPKTIEDWRSRFPDIPVVYKTK